MEKIAATENASEYFPRISHVLLAGIWITLATEPALPSWDFKNNDEVPFRDETGAWYSVRTGSIQAVRYDPTTVKGAGDNVLLNVFGQPNATLVRALESVGRGTERLADELGEQARVGVLRH